MSCAPGLEFKAEGGYGAGNWGKFDFRFQFVDTLWSRQSLARSQNGSMKC